ncbi:DNA-binding winged helix-turn-helix (wHTH) protein [Enterobacter sp. AG326]|uniref:winged helix-turn-helix domain-containing protein n=1 Tax=Enterobacter sp. AG326 TaxID=2183902 RepID=UPI001061AE02|nr:winged helix-turn-helix domain-containing protein [Enterobacter sp. AG326]TDP13492.1 DNA-binding winged helix-turn-helix (wHTH) protein [Enterobacter sp. AG326]
MKYLINFEILFDSEKKELSAIKNHKIAVPLTTTASRLLEEIIQHPQKVLPRALLLKRVWEDNGYSASDASLNNNISLLRKYFSSLSNAEIDLMTIPKIGFQLNATVELQDEVTKNEDQVDKKENIRQKGWKKYFLFLRSQLESKEYISYSLIILFLITISFIILYFIFTDTEDIAITKRKTHKTGEIEKCAVFNLSTDSTTVKSVLEAYPIITELCKNTTGNVYYDFSSLSKERYRLLFVSVCLNNEKAGYIKCENLKSYSKL